MNFKRIIKHLSIGQAAVKRLFPSNVMDTIEQAIRQAEATHDGQICFAVEAGLALKPLLAKQSGRARAIEVFSNLHVWDTEHNNGVLIYLLLADRDVEIVADRGIHAKLGNETWESVCREMEEAFRSGKFEQGVIDGIRSVGCHLASHFPHTGEKSNELPDRPKLL